jgi:Kef-type K+ transport system membrane component KefB
MADKAIGIIALIMGITALSVVVSKKSNTPAVLGSLLGGLRGLQQTAVSPVTGGK